MAGEFIAGAIVAKLVMDAANWAKSVKDVEGDQKRLGGMSDEASAKFKKMGMAMTVAGGAIVGMLGLMVKNYVKAGDEVQKMAIRTGFSTEALSELRYAAEISGANLESLEKGVKKMSKTIVDAGDGMATYVKAFDRIGISVKDLEGLNPEQQFLKIGHAIASIKDPTTRAAAAVDIFGRAGTQLLPLFNEGVAGMERLRQEAHRLGIVFDQEAANKAARLADAQTTLKASMQGVSKSIAETIVPMLASFAENIAGVISKITEWMNKNPGLAKTIVTIVGGLGALMAILGPLAIMLPSLVTGVGMLAGAFAGILGPIALVTAAVGVAAVTFLKLKAAKDAAREAGERYEENVKKLKDKLNETRKAVGMSAEEWNKLIKAYDGNYAALAMAIHKGKEGKEMQEALAEVSKKSKAAYDEQKESTKELGDAFSYVHEKQKTWLDYINTIGIQSIKGKNERIKELQGYLAGLDDALKRGEISLTNYRLAVEAAKNEIKSLSTELGYTAVPAAREFGDVIGQAPGLLNQAEFAAQSMELRIANLASQWGTTATDVRIAGYNMLAMMMQLSGVGFPQLTFASEQTTTAVKSQWDDMADGIKTSWIENLSAALQGSKSFGDAINSVWDTMKQQFFDTIAKMVAQWSLQFIGGLLSGGKDLLSGLTGIFKDIGGFFSSLFGGGGAGGAGGISGAITGGAGAISGIWTGIGAAIGTFLGGILGGGREKDLVRQGRDQIWWLQKIQEFEEVILSELYKIKDERLGEMFPKFDSMLEELYQIRDATKGTYSALTSQGTAYVDVFRSAIFEGVGERIVGNIGLLGSDLTGSLSDLKGGLAGELSHLGGNLAGEIYNLREEFGLGIDYMADRIGGISFDIDTEGMADAIMKRMPSAQGGGVFTSPGPVMTHGTAAMPEIIMRSSASPKGMTKVDFQYNPTVRIDGTMINSRDYARRELIPEIISALDVNANACLTELQEKLNKGR